jgi:hypothetical protein
MPLDLDSPKPDRLHVNADDAATVRHLMKTSGKTKDEVIAVIKKVGGNLETVQRELTRGRASEDPV